LKTEYSVNILDFALVLKKMLYIFIILFFEIGCASAKESLKELQIQANRIFELGMWYYND
jgi:hypothetical protein